MQIVAHTVVHGRMTAPCQGGQRCASGKRENVTRQNGIAQPQAQSDEGQDECGKPDNPAEADRSFTDNHLYDVERDFTCVSHATHRSNKGSPNRTIRSR